MRLLLDTQVLLWSLLTPERLSPAAAEAVLDVSNAVFVSAASIWEAEIKASYGKLVLPGDLAEATQQMGCDLIDITAADAAARLPLHHRDPFDRMILAQARARGLILLTADRALAAYDVPIIQAEA